MLRAPTDTAAPAWTVLLQVCFGLTRQPLLHGHAHHYQSNNDGDTQDVLATAVIGLYAVSRHELSLHTAAQLGSTAVDDIDIRRKFVYFEYTAFDFLCIDCSIFLDCFAAKVLARSHGSIHYSHDFLPNAAQF